MTGLAAHVNPHSFAVRIRTAGLSLPPISMRLPWREQAALLLSGILPPPESGVLKCGVQGVTSSISHSVYFGAQSLSECDSG